MELECDEALRLIIPKVAAQSFVMDYVLRHLFMTFPTFERHKVAEALLSRAEDVSWLKGIASSESQAERLADIVVRAQEEVNQLVRNALQATEKVDIKISMIEQ